MMEKKISRRGFLKSSSAAVAATTIAGSGRPVLADGSAATSENRPRSQVFFTRDISPKGLADIFARINKPLHGKVGIKLHSGEPHGPNLLPNSLIQSLQEKLPDSNIVECNVLYPSPRRQTSSHRETLKTNGFNFCPVDIMDAEGDAALSVPRTPGVADGQLKEIAVGKHMLDYDSLLVYTHFKGHAMAGFGGSLKNLAIGCASGQVGKKQIHGAGWETGERFLERMVEAGKAMTAHFGESIVYINVLKNISVDCDCDAHGAKPTCDDIGILGSTDILAIDQASVDLVYGMPESQRKDIVERIESRSGRHQLAHMKTLAMGNDQYELIRI